MSRKFASLMIIYFTSPKRCPLLGMGRADPKDYFSSQSRTYKDFRPTYPAALFDWLAMISPSRRRCWDCGCGTGQATCDLARIFDEVIATDLSQKQIDLAVKRFNISYRQEAAEQSSIDSGSVDLIFVAQALHWFNHPLFFPEVRRVSKPGGVLVALTYNLSSISPELDALVDEFYRKRLEPYWPAERKHVEEGYRSVSFPFQRIESPNLSLTANWNFQQFLGYITSWSAVALCKARTGIDPSEELAPELERRWGMKSAEKQINWPITLLAGSVD